MRLQNSRILITGVQGQVGFELVKSLASTGAELILAGRRPEQFGRLGYPTVALDLSQPSELRAKIRELKPQILINPAAHTAVDKAESEKDLSFTVNRDAVDAMAKTMRELRGCMIHFSTDYVYNASHDRPNKEDDAKNPPNVYSASKWAGEEALAHADLPYVCLRTSWVYGAQGNNFVKTMLKLGREREQLNIVSDQVGSPTNALTLAQAVTRILTKNPGDVLGYLSTVSGAYNISDSGYTNWYEFAQEIFKAARELGIDLKVKDVGAIRTEDYKTPASRPKNSRLDLSKLAQTFDFVPPTWQRSLRSHLYQASLGNL